MSLLQSLMGKLETPWLAYCLGTPYCLMLVV